MSAFEIVSMDYNSRMDFISNNFISYLRKLVWRVIFIFMLLKNFMELV